MIRRRINTFPTMKRRQISFIGLVVVFALSLTGTPALAIYGGTPATGDTVVVGLLRSQSGTTSGCSGALVAPRVVMTASHCLTGNVQNVWIPEPGTDLRDLTTKRIQAEKIFIPESFSMSVFPYQNDFGIIILKSAFPNVKTLEIAPIENVKKWIAEEAEVTHIGYGCTALVDAPPCGVTSPVPNKFSTVFSRDIPSQFNSLVAGTFSATKISVEKTICGGDSGSPLLKEVSGQFVYVGAQSSSNGAGCT